MARTDASGEPPTNFVFLLADDISAEDLGCYGHRFHETPTADAYRPLARAVLRVQLAGDFRRPDFSDLRQRFAQSPAQIGHLIEAVDTRVMNPLQHLLGTKGLFAQIDEEILQFR